jgi:hypothetical protein
MGTVLISASISLDGLSAGPEVAVERPMGTGGGRLHEWLFAGDGERGVDPEVARDLGGTAGAIVMGDRVVLVMGGADLQARRGSRTRGSASVADVARG